MEQFLFKEEIMDSGFFQLRDCWSSIPYSYIPIFPDSGFFFQLRDCWRMEQFLFKEEIS
jgi:hypothetical protein